MICQIGTYQIHVLSILYVTSSFETIAKPVYFGLEEIAVVAIIFLYRRPPARSLRYELGLEDR